MSAQFIQPITPAKIEWLASGTPLAADYGDIYFSQHGGVEETRHVFIAGNQLPERWKNLTEHPGASFIIGETGFGTGLNFLLSSQLWLEASTADSHLTYISIEKHPLCKEDLARAIGNWPQFAAVGNELLNHYPPLVHGLHVLDLADGRIRLLLFFGEVETTLDELLDTSHPAFSGITGAKIDAWFLDGFAPGKNPAMWQPDVLYKLGLLSKAGTTAATFTVAGLIRQGLTAAGFQIEKTPGYGNKREMLTARFTGYSQQTQTAKISNGQTPWHILYPPPTKQKPERKAVVIGGGLAGCHSAYALASRGWQVILLERNAAVATGASGNPQGVLFTRLSHRHAALTDFALASLNFSSHFYRQLFRSGLLKYREDGEFCGMLQLASNDKESRLFEQIAQLYANAPDLVRFVGQADGEAVCGIPIESSGLLFPGSGWLNPQAVCQSLSSHPLIKTRVFEEVIHLQREQNGWSLMGKNGELIEQAEIVIIANSYDAAQFEQTRSLPIKVIRGQVSYLPACDTSRALQTVLCRDGYLTPAHNDQHCLGASFDLHDLSPQMSAASHQENLANLPVLSSQLSSTWLEKLPAPAELQGRVSFRGATPDYLPMAGPVPDLALCSDQFADLAKNAKQSIARPGCWLPGLFVNIGHGGRGITYAPLAADLIAALINDEPKPMAQSLWRALSPARFAIRNLIRSHVAR